MTFRQINREFQIWGRTAGLLVKGLDKSQHTVLYHSGRGTMRYKSIAIQ